MSTWPDRDDLNIDPKRLVELTDSADARGVVDDDLVERLRMRAVGVVEGYCLHYVRPFVDPPGNVREWGLAIWRYLLYSRRADTMTMPDSVGEDYKSAIRSLEMVAAEKMNLDLPMEATGLPPSKTAGGLIANVERRFGRGRDGLG